MNENSPKKVLNPENPSSPPLIRSAELFARCSEVLIQHEGQIYRLRITKNGKLVMNK